MGHIINRRTLLKGTAVTFVAGPLATSSQAAVVPGADGYTYEITRTDAEWREQLGEHDFHIMREGGTEIPKSEKVLEAQNEQLATKLKLTDMNSSPTQVCGAVALSSTYTAPEVKLGPKLPAVPPRNASAVSALYKGRDANYVATLTVQTIRPDDKTYAADSAMIIKGFQLLPPG